MTIPRHPRRQFLSQMLAAGLMLSIAVAAAHADEEELPIAKVPGKVLAAADKAVPKAKWTSATRCTEDGETWIELEGTNARGRGVWITLYEDGTIDEVSTEILLKEIPAVVTQAVKTKFPRFVASAGYEVREDGKVVRYDIEGKRPRDKEDITLSVSPDGKSIEVDE